MGCACSRGNPEALTHSRTSSPWLKQANTCPVRPASWSRICSPVRTSPGARMQSGLAASLRPIPMISRQRGALAAPRTGRAHVRDDARLKLIYPVKSSRINRVLFDQSSDQTQEFLLFRTCTPTQKCCDVFMFHLPSRSDVGFVTDEQSPRRVSDQVPAVAAWTFIELARLLHAGSCQVEIAHPL